MLTGGFAKPLQCFGVVLWHPLLFGERSLSCAVVANQDASKLKVGTIVKSMVQVGRPRLNRFSHRFGHDHPAPSYPRKCGAEYNPTITSITRIDFYQ